LALNRHGLGINIDLTGNATGGIGKLGGVFGKFQSMLPPSVSQFGSMGLKLGLVGAAAFGAVKAFQAIGAAISYTIERAGAFEKGMAEVSTLLDDQQTKMLPQLSKEVLNLGVQYGQSMDIMTKATYQAISAGVAFERVPEFMAVAGKLAVGGVTDMETAVDGLTSITNAWGLSMEETGGVADQMFVAMRAGKTNIEELSRSIGQVAPIAAQMKVPLGDVLAMTATLTKGGLTTSEAITGIRQAMVTAMRQTPSFVKEAKKLGIAFDQTTISQMGFANWATMVANKAKAAGVPISKFFRNVQGLAAVLTLSGKGMKDNATIMEQMKDSTGAADEAFRKMTETYEFKSARASAAVDKFSIRAGNFFLPLAKGWQDFKTSFFEGLSAEIEKWQWMWDVGWELIWVDLKMALMNIGLYFVEWADDFAKNIEGLFDMVGIDVKAISKGTGAVRAGLEQSISAAQEEWSKLWEQGQFNAMKRRDEEREAVGKDQPQVNVNNKVNIGNKKVHESFQAYEQAFFVRDYQATRI
jgi:TP901 family phage tail tape measure protein